MLGYILSAILVESLNWKYAFYLQAVLLAPIALLYILYPVKYLVFYNQEEEINQGCTGTTSRKIIK